MKDLKTMIISSEGPIDVTYFAPLPLPSTLFITFVYS